jgi:hypothetical protein
MNMITKLLLIVRVINKVTLFLGPCYLQTEEVFLNEG